MAEYIDREAALAAIAEEEKDYDFDTRDVLSGLYIAEDCVRKVPAADVAPVRHGRWIVLESYRDGGTAQRCSECRELMYFYRTTPRNHCPNCGAKMDEDGDEE